MSRHPGADRWSIFILEKNVNVHKFFKYLGFHIEKIASESKNKTVDYFQEFSIKKKEMNTVIATMTKWSTSVLEHIIHHYIRRFI